MKPKTSDQSDSEYLEECLDEGLRAWTWIGFIIFGATVAALVLL